MAEGVKDVRDHKADGENNGDGSAAKVQEEGGSRYEGDGDSAVVGEGGCGVKA